MARRAGAPLAGLVLVFGLMTLLPAAAGADATELLADWQMNEAAGATTMVDDSGNGIDGAIGDAVQTGVSSDGATAYRWSNTDPTAPPAKPERLVIVDDDRLNPGSDDYAITMRFRTTRPFGNMIQKGQSGAEGGMWKWQMPSGQLVCLFRGLAENGRELEAVVNSGAPELGYAPLNDGEWHTARCERLQDRVVLTIDAGTPDQRVRTAFNSPTGSIHNDVPLTIAGKLNCNQFTITCDYFVGDIDYVYIETGPRTPPNAPPTANADGTCEFLDCSFTAAGSFDPDGYIDSYNWDFGDGSFGEGFAPSHTYDEPGTYDVALTVEDDDGDVDTDVISVTVDTEPPVASFDVVCDFLECMFDGSASLDPDGSVVGYSWDFGDGTTDEGVSPVHTYAAEGTYDITLVVTDDDGATGAATGAVAVAAALPVHLHELVVSPWDLDGDKWMARVVVKVRDADGSPRAGVEITARFGARERSCVTGSNGNCRLKVKVDDARAKIPFEVIAVDWVGGYDPGANRDVDGDGDGETVLVLRPFSAVHLHDLVASPWDLEGDKWMARVIVKVRDAAGDPHAGVDVTVRLGARERSCITGAGGNCKVKVKVADTRAKLPAEVIAVDWGAGYDPAANRDVDGDGDTETVMVLRPF